MDIPHTIASDRLELVLLSPPVMGALAGGDRVGAGREVSCVFPADWPDEHGARWLRRRREQVLADPSEAPWLGRVMVLTSSRVAVGYLGFHGKPDAGGAAEIGYTVFEGHRRRGYAWEAVNALWGWARSVHGVRRFRASVSPTNTASLALVRKLGMRQVGTQWDDEDGEELVFLREEGGVVLNPYASFLGNRDADTVIAGTVARLETLMGRLDAAAADRSPRPGKWSAREILCHLADTEVVFAFRLRQTLAEPNHTIQPFDQGIWGERYAAYTTAEAMALMRATRAWNLALIRRVTSSERARPVTHPERGAMTFQVIVETMGGHDLNHLGQIEAIAGG